ncbi:hypothetical protein PtrM4_057540 [Pyrenophora tritici-repentis]|uniref:Uncharacterized protein n=1 Tax=Pyrenophora tritici-repentis TaxID=45151 RepID=A0A834VRE8_9PLEO|nr:hypothetical protein A1F99_044650 [Pyrenophora tritici-repentis]KAF7574131.1 hypothetical protein PtrM4_057540 [Pyrenophora tritici-repentis]KAI1508934.1 hypothetical protein Ptr86124_012233 [Pyrenophora tritici-repentis]
MSVDSTKKSFQATGAWPMDVELEPAAQNFDAAVEAKQLSVALHSLQAQNSLLHDENDSLRAALNAKKKHQKQSCKLDLQQRNEYHGGAVFWSPRKIREARAREAVKQREDEAAQHQKTEMREPIGR